MIQIATVAELLVRIGGDSSGLRREINNSQRQMKRAFGPEALAVSEGAATVLGGIALAIGAVGVASVKMAADMQANKTAFSTLLGSAEQADTMMRDLATFAANTPFELPGLVTSAKKLMAFQFAAEDIIPIMAAVGDAVALVGGGQEAIDSISRALGQIQAKGKLSAEEMNQLSERGINGWKYIADEMGISTGEVMALSAKGAIDATTAIDAVIKGMQTNFAGGMEGMSKTVPGLLSTIKDNVSAVMREIGGKITVGLDLTAVLQKAANYLGTFASAVEGAGIKQAILGLIPPKATAAVFALSGALIAVAIPAMHAFGLSVWASLAPMLPFIAAGVAIGLLAYQIWKNWEPLSELFSSLWDVISTVTSTAWDAITSILTYTWDFIAGLIDNSIGWIITGIGKAWNAVEEMTANVWNSIGGVIDSAWQGIKSIIASGVDWIVSKMQPLLDLVGAAIPSGLTNFFNSVSSGLDKVKSSANNIKIGFSSNDISELIPDSGSKLNTTFTGLHGKSGESPASAGSTAGSGSGKNDAEKDSEKAEKAYESLKKQAKNTSKSIKDEWISLTGTQIDALDNWKSKELESLNESKSANESYANDLARLDQIYAEKKKKILYDQQKDTNSIWDSAKTDATDYQNKIAEIGLKGVDKQKFDIDTSASEQIDKLINKYRDLSAEYANGTKKQQEDYRNAWAENGIQFEITENGMVTFNKQIADKQLVIEKEKDQKIKDLHFERTKWQQELDQAYADGDLARFQEQLNSKQALLEQDIKGQQAMADLYKTVWDDAHMSTTAITAKIGSGAYDGLKTGISDVLNGTKSIGEAWSALGGTIRSTIANMAAQWIAAQIAMAIFGKGNQAATGAAAAAGGAGVATAWAPAAAMVSLATFGANAGPAMAGIALTTGLAGVLSAVGGKATGGVVNGAGSGTSDSILTWLSNGEYVIKASSVKELGINALNTLNAGRMPAFATGGLVTGSSLASISGKYGNAAVGGLNGDMRKEDNQSPKMQNQENHLHLHALDGKSAEKWLLNGGGKIITKYLNNQARAFGMGV